MRTACILALFVLTSCASAQPATAPPATSPSAVASAAAVASPTPSASPVTAAATPTASASPTAPAAYGVFLNYMPNAVPAQPGPVEVISLVSLDGQVVAQATPVPRPPNAPGPLGLSVSNSAVYFLDGDTQVRALTPDGKIRDVTTVPGSATVGSSFAVSPDDRRVAVAVLDYSASPVKARLYVEDLVGHGNHLDIYASTLAFQGGLGAPIFQVMGWHQGHIVLFLGNETAFTGYHLIDATNATRLASACPDGWAPTGNPEPAGVLCFRNIAGNTNQWDLAVESWNGTVTPVPKTPYGPYCTGLSPKGTTVACSGQPIIVHLVADGTPIYVSASRVVLGWIDETHVVVGADNPPGNEVVDIATGVVAPTTAKGSFVSALPGGLD